MDVLDQSNNMISIPSELDLLPHIDVGKFNHKFHRNDEAMSKGSDPDSYLVRLEISSQRSS